MKKINKILIAAVIILIVFAAITTFTQDNVQTLDEYTTIIGNNSNGTVYKITCGNNSSTDTAIVILGVHSLESGIHNATNETIMKFTKNDTLNRKYIVYFIKLNFKDSGMNTSDYDTNRHMGELLANEYVVPDIEKYDPYVVVDVHEMENYWDKQRYVGVVDNKSTTTMEYADKISEYTGFPVYTVNAGTSPKWVTIPIAKKNHNVILFETAQADNQANKTQTAIDLVRAIDSLTVY
ncbi:hypothetical protein [uncultured Methanobrevibacter sp.]|uniref:hypothetical protein n=1 Tax=uncultured Methanobrevibacter sp. TaxID=253161 RepID=UPI002633A6E5|nr:hypothetical protein [uncultured Methanobrevibacter sp.]